MEGAAVAAVGEGALEAQEALRRREQFGKIVLTVGDAEAAGRPAAGAG